MKVSNLVTLAPATQELPFEGLESPDLHPYVDPSRRVSNLVTFYCVRLDGLRVSNLVTFHH